jgi:hypothetical protein
MPQALVGQISQVQLIALLRKAQRGQTMPRHGVEGSILHITVPDPNEDTLLHVFPVDPKREESLVSLWYSLIQLYGEEGEEIAAQTLGAKALPRAICSVLVRKGRLIRLGEEVYRIPQSSDMRDHGVSGS